MPRCLCLFHDGFHGENICHRNFSWGFSDFTYMLIKSTHVGIGYITCICIIYIISCLFLFIYIFVHILIRLSCISTFNRIKDSSILQSSLTKWEHNTPISNQHPKYRCLYDEIMLIDSELFIIFLWVLLFCGDWFCSHCLKILNFLVSINVALG